MGLLDGALGALLKGGGGQKLLGAVMGMIGGGGLAGLLQAFQGKGGDLAQKADSWVGTGQNHEMSADDVRRALGDAQIKEFAREAGISEDEAAVQLSHMLPEVVDKLTPEGQVPEGQDLTRRLEELQA